jgi:hypothetical protein
LRDVLFAIAIGFFLYQGVTSTIIGIFGYSSANLGETILIFGTAGGLGAIVMMLFSFGKDRERPSLSSPTQLLRDSGRMGMLAAALSVIAFALIPDIVLGIRGSAGSGLGRAALGDALSWGLFSGLLLGLDAVVFHYGFRLRMRRQGGGPLRWVRFLDWATDHLLLISTGASYGWIHLELRDYLATTHSPGPIPPVATRRTPEVALPS